MDNSGADKADSPQVVELPLHKGEGSAVAQPGLGTAPPKDWVAAVRKAA
ncbi:MAG TPA: hypothetical protein GX499_04245, partial [Clostridiales bacterium]|nr:hypothetical protein [Clostridiales bacterium]